MSKKRNKVTVLLDAEDFRRFEEYCDKHGFKKSTLIARLIRDHLVEQSFGLQRDLPLDEYRTTRRVDQT